MKISSFFRTFDISSRGLAVEKKRLAVTAENIANANTTRTADGLPYRRKVVTQKTISENLHFGSSLKNAQLRLRTNSQSHFAKPSNFPSGMDSTDIMEIKTQIHEQNKFRQVYDPGHPDADANGMVKYPAINVVNEMLELISASRSYEANVTLMNATKNIAKKALGI